MKETLAIAGVILGTILTVLFYLVMIGFIARVMYEIFMLGWGLL